MHLDFTAEQDALRDSVRAVLAKECTPAFVRAHVERVVRGQGSDSGEQLGKTFAGLDWPALTISEDHGGLGLGYIELAIVAEELGRVIAPGSFLATVAGLAAAVRAAGGPQADPWLRRVAAGEVTGTFVDPACTDVVARGGPDWTLTGRARWVWCGGEVDELAVPVRAADDSAIVAIAVVPTAQASVVRLRCPDATRTIAHVEVDGLALGADRVLEVTGDAVERAVQETTVALATEMVGTCSAILDTTVAYAKERIQFGAPIGSFQAVKHKLADMFVAIERARATSLFAAATIAEDDPRRAVATSMAKAAAGDCQRLVAQDGIQLLGGIGYTWEHDQHLFVKRAKSGDALFGSAAEHRARVADALGI